jgi:hypothetical protein
VLWPSWSHIQGGHDYQLAPTQAKLVSFVLWHILISASILCNQYKCWSIFVQTIQVLLEQSTYYLTFLTITRPQFRYTSQESTDPQVQEPETYYKFPKMWDVFWTDNE